MLILLPISAVYSYERHGLVSAIGTSIFVISLFLMFLSSTIYHSMSYGSTHKYILRIIDHSMIYIAIAGSYTPVVLSLMNDWRGYLIIAIQWGTTIFGILYKIFAKKVNEKFSLALYLIMGWLVIFIIPQIIGQTGPVFWGLMLAGGLCYTVGAGFYAKEALLPHDLASLHPSCFCSPILGYCLFHVESCQLDSLTLSSLKII